MVRKKMNSDLRVWRVDFSWKKVMELCGKWWLGPINKGHISYVSPGEPFFAQRKAHFALLTRRDILGPARKRQKLQGIPRRCSPLLAR
ncbi:hypothetical protein A2U01_0058990 [Trifolium medium]|uniref:Uncharacterized protein n=1 Tax=Trifolium medium TaxID=97028 RepID=A0A392RNU9_9FABA|nr:hypothetical protein [Trifolium medium]